MCDAPPLKEPLINCLKCHHGEECFPASCPLCSQDQLPVAQRWANVSGSEGGTFQIPGRFNYPAFQKKKRTDCSFIHAVKAGLNLYKAVV